MEEWMKKCLLCVHATYENKEEADEISCTCKNGKCNYKRIENHKKYVIKIIISPWISDFVCNGSYVVNGEKYVVLGNMESAKRYSSRRRAENAYNKMYGTYVNITSMHEVIEVDE